ncbi:MAG: class I SAM-dependent methyltransferase [Gammaproteobacteria bacterium]|nr:class I SAM-dependent methyltransferase [Gammaproteobacteria bacterium]
MSSDHTCRSCGSAHLDSFLNLGVTPLADGLLREEHLEMQEPTYPLEVTFCKDCGLMQILETVSAEKLFCDDYPYYSSFSEYLLKHSRENVLDLIQRRGLNDSSFVVELASNDGYLLKNYIEQGVSVLGIDPAEGPAKAAEEIGVPTLNTFFTKELAVRLKAEGKSADVIHGNNVLAHVPDTNGFVEGIGLLLKDDGVAVMEVPYAKDLIDHIEFDTIYHEHLCYFTVTALDNLFRRHSLYLNDIKRLSIHGGSLRLYVEKYENVSDTVKELLALEKKEGLDRINYYRDFSLRVESFKNELLSLLTDLKAKGHSIAAYGAAAKGSTMINYVGIGTDLVDFVVDKNIHKQGRYMPGKHIPIYDPKKLMEDKPDYVLILPWNFADEILQQQQAFRDAGGKFIVPIPVPKIV